MMTPHTSDSLRPVVLGVAIMVVGPALVPEAVIATLTATPLRQVGTAVLALAVLAGLSFWAVPRVSVRGSPAAEGGDD
jgi:hypothetical protein